MAASDTKRQRRYVPKCDDSAIDLPKIYLIKAVR